MPPLTAPDLCRKTVRTWQHGHTLFIAPAVEELCGMFRTVGYFSGANSTGPAIRRCSKSLLVVDEDVMICHAGLNTPILEALSRLGYAIRDEGRTIDSQLKVL